MSEPLLERLSRFTPDAGGLDRDALLFAAGHASARPSRGWIALAGLLASTQALSLALLWPHSAPPTVGRSVPIAATSQRPGDVPDQPAEAPAGAALWAAHSHLPELDAADRPAGTGTYVDSGPPLRAFAPPPPSILN